MECHVTSCVDLKKQTEKLKHQKQNIKEDILEWENKYVNLQEESEKLVKEMKEEIDKKDEAIGQLSTTNEELESYIEYLLKSECIAY